MKLFGITIANTTLALAGFDAVVCFLAFGAVGGLVPVMNDLLGVQAWVPLQHAWMVIVALSALASFEAYETRTRRDLRGSSARIAVAGMFAFLAIVVTAPLHAFPVERAVSLVALGAVVLTIVGFGVLARAIGLRFSPIRDRLGETVLVVGTGARAARLREMLGEAHQGRIATIAPFPVQGVVAAAERIGVKTIVDAADARRAAAGANLCSECRRRNIEVISDSEYYERLTGRVDIGAPDAVANLAEAGQPTGRATASITRLSDVVIAGMLLVMVLPVLVLAMAAVKLSSPGPIFFRQQRVGMGGKTFEIFKLRTMSHQTEPRRGRRFAAKNDPRITPIGRILRRTRIDELPQLLNVLKGDMRMVGPRPEQPGQGFVDRFNREIPGYNLRHRVRPGLTGWAQVNFGYCGEELADHWTKTSYDLFYIKNRSVFFDLFILTKTVHTVIFGDGADAATIHSTSPRRFDFVTCR